MQTVHTRIWLFCFLCTIAGLATAQDTILQRVVALEFNENTLVGHVDNLLIQKNIALSFNSSRVDLDELIVLPKKPMTLRQLVNRLFYKNQLQLIPSKNKVVIRFLDAKLDPMINVRGYLRDRETGEPIIGATIQEVGSYSSTFTGRSGFLASRFHETVVNCDLVI